MSSRTLGDYTLIKQIGQGPLGAVFLAEQRFMKKQFAIKVLPEDLASDRNFIQRFEEEVGRLSVLDHPNIVKIHNVSFAEGRYFLVTDCVVDEYGETTNLSQYMAAHGKRLDEVELLRLTKQIAQALDYAHNAKVWGKEVVHRGIKLNNILVGKEEEGAYLVLSDFGLSRIIGTGNVLTRTYQAVAESLGVSSAGGGKREQVSYSHSSLETQKLAALHTSFLQNYAFLAPEQKKMDHSIDGKADIYAFGVLAYFLIMGKFPEGIFDMPSQKAREYRYDWDRLICRCLQSDPEKRPSVLMPLLDEIVQRKFSSDAISLSDQKVEVSREQKSPSSVLEKEEKKRGPKPVLHDPQLERPEDDLVDPPTELQVEEPSVKRYRPERQEVKNIQPLLTDMVVIEGGKFYRGSNDGNRDEMPCHEVILPSFAIDIHPVTNEQFVRFLEVMGGEKDSGHRDIIRLRDSRIKRSGGKLNVESGYLKHPVVGVTWYGAVAYAKWVGKRLPTEAEWEIAACGGLKSPLYPTGDEIEKTQANFFSSDTTAVMSYAPNGRGLYDMAGNVYEWCQDWYDYNYYDTAMQEPDNPRGPLQGVYRVLRGGCWKSLKEDLRCSRRHRNNPGTVNGTYGFRCAADVE